MGRQYVGDTLERTYRFYNSSVANNQQPDYNNPIDLTGISIVFHIKQGNVIFYFTAASGHLTIVPLLGTIEVKLLSADTAKLISHDTVKSYFIFTDTNGDVATRVVQVEHFEQL